MASTVPASSGNKGFWADWRSLGPLRKRLGEKGSSGPQAARVWGFVARSVASVWRTAVTRTLSSSPPPSLCRAALLAPLSRPPGPPGEKAESSCCRPLLTRSLAKSPNEPELSESEPVSCLHSDLGKYSTASLLLDGILKSMLSTSDPIFAVSKQLSGSVSSSEEKSLPPVLRVRLADKLSS